MMSLSSCPRCGPVVAGETRRDLPGHPGRTYSYKSCPSCLQVLLLPGEEIHDRERNESFASPFQYSRSLVSVPGCWKRLPTIEPITNENIAAIFALFVPRQDDIWLATYPKCGTTWIQNVLSHLVYNSHCTGPVQVGLRLTDDVLWMDALCSINGVDSTIVHINELPRDRPRIFKSHAPLGLLEPFVARSAKVVHVARNPKGMINSKLHLFVL